MQQSQREFEEFQRQQTRQRQLSQHQVATEKFLKQELIIWLLVIGLLFATSFVQLVFSISSDFHAIIQWGFIIIASMVLGMLIKRIHEVFRFKIPEEPKDETKNPDPFINRTATEQPYRPYEEGHSNL